MLPNLKKINGEAFTPEEMEEAMNEIKARADAKAEEIAAKAAAKEEAADGDVQIAEGKASDSEAVEPDADEAGEAIPMKKLTEDELEALWYQFKAMDHNKDGKINAKELRSIMKELGEDFTTKQINRMIKSVDSNNDGMISFDEFCTSCAKPAEKVEEEPEE
jgi:hypothetical protein